MSISYLHFPISATAVLLILSLYRFWVCLHRLGCLQEVTRRDPVLFSRDMAIAVLALLPMALALLDWTGIVLPRTTGPMSSPVAVVLSMSCILCSVLWAVHESSNRLTGHWAGARESALRTVAALQIIDAAELAFAREVLRKHDV